LLPLRGLVDAVLAASTSAGSYLHGERHWRAVAHAGMELAPLVPGARRDVVFLFALFHDSRRLNDDDDPEHGARAAALAEELHGDLYDIGHEGLDLLRLACRDHAGGATSAEPTIAACWDADRLNLWRVGFVPSPALLSTAAAREPDRIRAAAAWHDEAPSWDALVERLGPATGLSA
jgi:uncharacterized protein